MRRVKKWSAVGVVLVTLAGFGVLAIFLGIGALPTLVVGLLAVWLLVLAMFWAARRLDPLVWMGAGGVVLVALFLPPHVIGAISSSNASQPGETETTFTYLLAMLPALIVAALLIFLGMTSFSKRYAESTDQPRNSRGQPKLSRRMGGVVLILAAALVVAVVYDYYWFIVWDATGDSLGVLWLILPALVILIAGGELLDVLPDKARFAGVLYWLLIPILFAVSHVAGGVNFRQLTEEHAAQTSRAIESYYAREGHYPQSLGQLVPRDALFLPGPVILYGQDWCYDGGQDYYRLGYVYREHWSNPHLLGRLYKAEGSVPAVPALCTVEITTLEKRYAWFALR